MACRQPGNLAASKGKFGGECSGGEANLDHWIIVGLGFRPPPGHMESIDASNDTKVHVTRWRDPKILDACNLASEKSACRRQATWPSVRTASWPPARMPLNGHSLAYCRLATSVAIWPLGRLAASSTGPCPPCHLAKGKLGRLQGTCALNT